MRHLWLILALLAGAGLAWLATAEPRPTPANAPARSFSSGRAMTDIRAIAARPHPVGSPQNRQVRDYLTARMRSLGLETRLQRDSAVAVRDGGATVLGADVENLIGVLPGRDRAAPTLALMAHYDSAPRSPGAGDDAAGVAVALEVIRAIKTRGVPARDIVVLLTDGEEPGMLGAEAFFERDPLAAHIGLVVNLEARGGAGRVIMFETSRGNGALIAALRKSSVGLTANSLANAVYQNMPNGTDLSAAVQAGKAGLNFAFVGRQFDYHSPTATVANLHEGAVQSMGREVLAFVGQIAFAPALPPKTPDMVFSQAFGSVIIAYPVWGGWVVLAAVAGLLAVAVVRARSRAPLRWKDAGLGAAASVSVLLLAAALLWLGRKATGTPEGFVWQLPLLARFPLWETAMALIGLAALVIPATLTARRDAVSVWLGALAPAAALAVPLQ
ncbi:MAG: peptidase family, partial [Caulobacteraceae bacterium]|nr:peptidase family [Caulobacteraceae bacterium]